MTSCAYYFLLWFLDVSHGCFVLPAFSPKWLTARTRLCALTWLFLCCQGYWCQSFVLVFQSSVKCPGDFFLISCFASLLLPARRLAESILSFPPKKTTGQLSVSVD